MTTDASDEWKRWHERRVATVSAPYGPLALTGTYWLEDYPDGQLPDVPGSWTAAGDAVLLTATGANRLTVDGRPLDGEVRLTADPGPASAARVACGERRIVVLLREGAWGVRDFDPVAGTRRAFRHRGHAPRSALVGAGALHAVRHRAAQRAGVQRGRAGTRARSRR
ncbi:hypothetical protein GCM10022384_66510 [Streptomyces marokkonensis]|uniref:Uncharacterized protein n=1 Tax=Streptomyces marokkonensis TaxID=324855 RepID=A0ABP7SJD7_9ACTN